MKEVDKHIVITAIIALTLIECFAMYLGYNGTLRMIIVAGIFAGAGIMLPQPKIKGGD